MSPRVQLVAESPRPGEIVTKKPTGVELTRASGIIRNKKVLKAWWLHLIPKKSKRSSCRYRKKMATPDSLCQSNHVFFSFLFFFEEKSIGRMLYYLVRYSFVFVRWLSNESWRKKVKGYRPTAVLILIFSLSPSVFYSDNQRQLEEKVEGKRSSTRSVGHQIRSAPTVDGERLSPPPTRENSRFEFVFPPPSFSIFFLLKLNNKNTKFWWKWQKESFHQLDYLGIVIRWPILKQCLLIIRGVANNNVFVIQQNKLPGMNWIKLNQTFEGH